MNIDIGPTQRLVVPGPKDSKVLAIRKSQAGSDDFVPHLGLLEVQALAQAAERGGKGRNAERDKLLIEALFDGCFRVSEALGIRPTDMVQSDVGWSVRIVGKGRKPGEAAISSSLAARLQSYAYRHGVEPGQFFFPITPARAWQIVDRAFKATGTRKPDHVGTVHVLRHSGALARLAATGNPKALQDQLRHRDAKMTLRYMKTLSKMESLRIQQQVDFGW